MNLYFDKLLEKQSKILEFNKCIRGYKTHIEQYAINNITTKDRKTHLQYEYIKRQLQCYTCQNISSQQNLSLREP